MAVEIPRPFLFNPIKHHLGYIFEFIKVHKRDVSGLKTELSLIGNSQIDLYYGPLSLTDVISEIKSHITSSFLTDKLAYIKLLDKYNDFLTITISDGSKWILREGNDPDRHIHFHPGRYSPYTFRIIAKHLKSLIAAHVLFENVGLEELNLARAQILALEPIKKLSLNHGIGKHVDLFNQMNAHD